MKVQAITKILKYPVVPVSVDCVVLKNRKLVLIKVDEKKKPYLKDKYVLPGGFVNVGETLKNAAVREVKEETGLKVKVIKMVNVYDNPKRDPRGHAISIAFFCKVIDGKVYRRGETKEIEFFSPREIKNLKIGLNHRKIIEDALE
jgi:8-oxo-dGTP diphosphatase